MRAIIYLWKDWMFKQTKDNLFRDRLGIIRCLWFLWCENLARDWLKHNKHFRHILSVHAFISTAVTPFMMRVVQQLEYSTDFSNTFGSVRHGILSNKLDYSFATVTTTYLFSNVLAGIMLVTVLPKILSDIWFRILSSRQMYKYSKHYFELHFLTYVTVKIFNITTRKISLNICFTKSRL